MPGSIADVRAATTDLKRPTDGGRARLLSECDNRAMPHRDRSLDTLLELNGQVLVIDEAGHWVKFVVNEVPASDEKPHGIDYTLTLHGPDGERLVGFDNAHHVMGKRRKGEAPPKDHRHRMHAVKPYMYTDAGALLEAFWSEVESMMRERGVWK